MNKYICVKRKDIPSDIFGRFNPIREVIDVNDITEYIEHANAISQNVKPAFHNHFQSRVDCLTNLRAWMKLNHVDMIDCREEVSHDHHYPRVD